MEFSACIIVVEGGQERSKYLAVTLWCIIQLLFKIN
jgi:hypothetical protein